MNKNKNAYSLRSTATGGAKFSFFIVVIATLLSISLTFFLRLNYTDLYMRLVKIPNYLFIAAFLLSIYGARRRQPLAIAALAISGYVLFRWGANILIAKIFLLMP